MCFASSASSLGHTTTTTPNTTTALITLDPPTRQSQLPVRSAANADQMPDHARLIALGLHAYMRDADIELALLSPALPAARDLRAKLLVETEGDLTEDVVVGLTEAGHGGFHGSQGAE